MMPGRAQIPPPLDTDFEDVHWALEAATALWERGEQEEALKWLRRAANSAADKDADMRAVELFKAAAEVANSIQKKRAPGSAAPSDPATPVSKRGAPSGRGETTTERRRKRGLFFDESEEATFVTPETALRRALLRIDPDYARRTDFQSEPDADDLERTSVPEDPRRAREPSRSPAPAASAPEATPADGEAVSLHSIPPEETSAVSAPEATARADSAASSPAISARAASSSPASSLPRGALPALRVAVLPIPEEGDVRLLFLTPGAEPPSGVATALLVPTSDRDAELLAELYDTTKAKV